MDNEACILVVDDESRNRRLLEALLIPLGHKVLMAENGKIALKMLEDMEPDLVLLDIMMPEMDGYAVCREIKNNPSTIDIPVVMVTSLSEVQDSVRALAAGADDFLSKPVDKIELKARVQSLLRVKAYNDFRRKYQEELEIQVANKTKQLKEASLETILKLTRAAEYKDEDTAAHIRRMSHYTAALAREMGIKKKTVETLLYAAPMHDIGKIGTPDRILLKPGKLDPEEWRIMKQHTEVGAEILDKSKTAVVKMGRIIALTHHEKWDGTGYPRSLKGAQIPLAGRITALADVFDALTSKRPYKEPFSIEKSFRIIKESKDSHFDPTVVQAFFAITSEILDIKEKFKDQGISQIYESNK